VIAWPTLLLALIAAAPGLGASDPGASADPLARAFGRLPTLWKPSLSPDGSRVVMVVQPTKLDFPVAVVHRFGTAESKLVIVSDEDKADLVECRFANEKRLLCRFHAAVNDAGLRYSATRLVAVDADGSDMRVLMQRRLRRRGTLGQFHDQIVDWLPDEPDAVLIEVPGKVGRGLSRLHIRSGRMKRVERERPHVRAWITDGTATARLRLEWTKDERTWRHRRPGERKWRVLSVDRPDDDDDERFRPIGFGDDPARLLALRRVDGRQALVSQDLIGEGEPRVVFADDEYDVWSVVTLGPHERVVGATWVTDRMHVAYFDPALEQAHRSLTRVLPGKQIVISDESWDRRYYLVFAYSDVDPGTWYRLDTETARLEPISEHRPELRDRTLAPMETIRHPAADGTLVPGYLTRPVGAGEGPLPTIVLPHGGPESRDVWGFDWLAQYLVARGYVVFQTNYRGSFGYGSDWVGRGGFQEWRRVVSDIDSGLDHLIEQGVTDPGRVCAVGWSYGGYAALMSAIEHPERFRCVVVIAGVADPAELIEQYRDFLNREWVEEYVSRSEEVTKHGSPMERVGELRAPVLIFHPDEDLNVDVRQGHDLAEALRNADKDVQYVEYDDDEHGIWRHASRIDMLTRIGVFLREHLAPRPADRRATGGPASGAAASTGGRTGAGGPGERAPADEGS
jgi:dipeptidyl aminopeptidase/acylaminoacyl peptidase